MHMFVDESERGGYLLAATVLEPSALHSTRTMMRELLLPGSRRVHFKTEKDSRRKLIASRLVHRGLTVHLYTGRGPSEKVRAALLERLAVDAIDAGVTRLVLDSRDPAANDRDRLVIGTRTKARDAGMVYEHMHSFTEPALWVSDAVAWCHGAGGDWRRRVNPLVGDVCDVGTLR